MHTKGSYMSLKPFFTSTNVFLHQKILSCLDLQRAGRGGQTDNGRLTIILHILHTREEGLHIHSGITTAVYSFLET